ncbi:protein GPR107 [Amborella trichopoda]|uniref:Uncharacterized protein n=1 Tax=Amborella trichopoda TaxID=13333 RepID=U5DE78_AMBTC|nr:protein GPR107 [Amborella trichopoda]ERN19732.1 hypothetical protein AMTR_s00062p00210470 [Amborella trichopoda]|eukprot:XP_006858265.1 protein GPR107 [Amborella trichopoda]
MAPPLPSLPCFYVLQFFLLFLAYQTAFADIRETRISTDSRPFIQILEFGFTRNGKLEVSVSNVSWSWPSGVNQAFNSSKLGFFVLPDEDWEELEMELSELSNTRNACVFETRSPSVNPLLTFSALNYSAKSISLSISEPDEYNLIFANCLSPLEITMNVKIVAYNLGKDGKKEYLSQGQGQLPTLYFIFSVVYFLLFLLWVSLCVMKWTWVTKIHYLMGLLVVVKSLNLLCEAMDKSRIQRTGTPHGWDMAFYAFSVLKGIMLFTVIALIGTGWSILKPSLQDKDKKLLAVVIPLQVLDNLLMVTIDEVGPSIKGWEMWKNVFLVLDFICCVVVLLPVVWSIKHLREASRSDGKAAKSLAKLTLFRQYYVVVISYVYFSRFVLFLMEEAVSYQYDWTCNLLLELVSVAFYLLTGYNFKPAQLNPYVRIDDDEEEVAMVAATMDGQLDDDDFEI